MADILDALAGFVIAPIVGGGLAGLVISAVGTEDASTQFALGSLCHAAIGLGCGKLQDRYARQGNVGNVSFFKGAKWGEYATGGLLAASALTVHADKTLPPPIDKAVSLLTFTRELKT